MSQIVTNFDTKTKVLTVEMDGKKVKDVHEIHFYTFGDTSGVEMRRLESNNDEDITVITKIIANADGEDEVSHESSQDSLTQEIAETLFPRKNLTGV